MELNLWGYWWCWSSAKSRQSSQHPFDALPPSDPLNPLLCEAFSHLAMESGLCRAQAKHLTPTKPTLVFLSLVLMLRLHKICMECFSHPFSPDPPTFLKHLAMELRTQANKISLAMVWIFHSLLNQMKKHLALLGTICWALLLRERKKTYS